MLLPAKLDATIRARFKTLLDEANTLLGAERARSREVSDAWQDAASRARHADAMNPYAAFDRPLASVLPDIPDRPEGMESRFVSLRTRTLTLLQTLSLRDGDSVSQHMKVVAGSTLKVAALGEIVGLLTGLLDDYDAGMLDPLVSRVEAELAADYLGQAEALLAGTHQGVADRVPAAVLAGAVLESGLRTLSGRQTPALAITGGNGRPKMLNALIDDLKNAGVYNELQAKELRGWADIRNAAAHGEFDKFDRGSGWFRACSRF
jgi:hypothetical protein